MVPSSWLKDGVQFHYDEMGSSTLYQLDEGRVPTVADGAQVHGEHALSGPIPPPPHQYQHQHQSPIYSAQGVSSHGGGFGTYNPHDSWGVSTPTSNQQRMQIAGMVAAAAQYPDDIDRSRWHEAQPPNDLSYSPTFSDSPIISSIGHRGARRSSDLDSLFEDSSDLGDDEEGQASMMMHAAAGVVHDSPAGVVALPSDHNHHDDDSFERPSPCGLSQQLQGQLNVSLSETGVELVQPVRGQGEYDMDLARKEDDEDEGEEEKETERSRHRTISFKNDDHIQTPDLEAFTIAPAAAPLQNVPAIPRTASVRAATTPPNKRGSCRARRRGNGVSKDTPTTKAAAARI
ncbi:hypothetical protein Z517_07567 [Fonsecaea pedrosoi CBS 271.37]|uniref:Uncharacterized protein n=1 Tax=Fonsecaea pedrosoi CBS 271.37 TaxID=1442368 RepID=A0A0D2GZ65_9EURO|nr:uncharacterized protein Z517_07567 [Fonsecaea pedrosoi CBS 271.37]KIW77734.1 hypothetical protein Z517_07567 [Fonsecaea pedrosoi CBS 271.37]